MSRYLITGLLAAVLSFSAQDNFTLTEVARDYNPIKNQTTVRLLSTRLSGEKDRYHSLSYAIYYSYPGLVSSLPKDVNFELVSVVKAPQLDSDLYVVFVVDGKEIHYGSNRSAIPKPVRGRPWVGERMVFSIPREEFMKMAAAETLSVKLGDVSFEFNEAARGLIWSFSKVIGQ